MEHVECEGCKQQLNGIVRDTSDTGPIFQQ